ncbi:substrate-binding periplasmic protein [Glaciecola sp. 1036]|uniref:substrate-binding periplasmic protein n=1 Tax=Alteromonadaceae TaxID=72275 RepID=UPI003D0039DC
MKTSLSLFIMVLSLGLVSCSQDQGQPMQNQTSIVSSETTSSSQDEATSSNKQTCSLTIGFDVWAPYQYVDVNDRVSGLDIELISEVTDYMGCTVDFRQGTWVSLLEDLRNGEVDMLLGASKTESRESFAFFSEPYRTEEFSLYIRKDDAKRAKYEDIASFIANGSKIGVVSSYYYGDKISSMLDDESIQEQFVFGIMGELNVARLLDMDIDAFLEDNFVGASMIRRKALGDYIVPHGFTVNTGNIYVMFSKGSVEPELVSQFNQVLTSLKAGEEYSAIMQKYAN